MMFDCLTSLSFFGTFSLPFGFSLPFDALPHTLSLSLSLSVQPCPPPVGRVEQALKCALSYLLFHEGEEFMAENVEYYREALGFDTKPDKVTQLNKPSLDRVGKNVCCLHVYCLQWRLQATT